MWVRFPLSALVFSLLINIYKKMKQKVKNLFVKEEKSNLLTSEMNIFEKEMFKTSHQTQSGNGSIKYTTSGNPFVDDFSILAAYREPRDINEIFATSDRLWNMSPIQFLKETFYLRMITRESKLLTGVKLTTQRGQGLKFEFYGRMLYLAENHFKTFVKNLPILIAAGSWYDIFEILRMDLEYNGLTNHGFKWTPVLDFIINGLADKDQNDLVKKYLPTINCASNCKTLRKQANSVIAKKIAIAMFSDKNFKKLNGHDKSLVFKQYRKLKASGTAHDWQQAISRQDFKHLNFSHIAGRALSKLVGTKFLKNNNLEEAFGKWILSQPTAKFTGYVHELFEPLAGGSPWYPVVVPQYREELINRQFKTLIDEASIDLDRQTNFIVCLDISSSMRTLASGTNMSCYDVGKAMALYFSELLIGKFKNTFLTFSDNVQMESWKGDTPSEKFKNYQADYYGSTNFLGVAKTLVALKNKGYKEEDFPTGIICISDCEFNPSNDANMPVFESFLNTLRKGGFSEEFVSKFKVVLWNLSNSYYDENITEVKVEDLADRPNLYYMSGLDPASIAFIMGTKYNPAIPKTAEELYEAAMNQELLNLLKI